MWQLLPTHWQVAIIMAIGIIGWEGAQAVAMLIGGVAPSVFRWASLAASAVLAIVVPLVDRFWPDVMRRWPWLASVTFPDLNGRWRGTLQSNWTDRTTGTAIDPREVVVDIRQGLLSVSVVLTTSESRSLSTWCRLEPTHGAKLYRIRHLYENEPQAGVAHRSARHEGMCWLELRSDDGPDCLTGQYYTYRGTRGDIALRRDLEVHTASSPQMPTATPA